MHFSYFFRSGRPNRKKAVKMTSQSPSGTLQAGPREGEIDQLFAPRASQGRQQQFLGRPGPSQSLSGTAPGRLWKQGRRPRAAQRPPGSHFGAILAPFWTPRGLKIDPNSSKIQNQPSKGRRTNAQHTTTTQHNNHATQPNPPPNATQRPATQHAPQHPPQHAQRATAAASAAAASA